MLPIVSISFSSPFSGTCALPCAADMVLTPTLVPSLPSFEPFAKVVRCLFFESCQWKMTGIWNMMSHEYVERDVAIA